MIIQDVYYHYNILPSLQMHQYRVAGVAKYICSHLHGIASDTDNIVVACLLHDMGNIIKFNMDLFPEFFEPKGVEYWQKVKDEFIKKYGKDEHVATLSIAKEVMCREFVMKNCHSREDGNPRDYQRDPRLRGDDTHGNHQISSQRVLDLIDAIGFSNAKRNAESTDYGWKIAAYADMRVEPYGITTVDKRLEDGNRRFKLNKPGESRQDFFQKMAKYIKQIESQIFEHTSITPHDITDQTIEPVIKTLQVKEW